MRHFSHHALQNWLLAGLLSVAGSATAAPSSALSAMTPAKALGWGPAHNLCGGYYMEPKVVSDYPSPKPPKQEVANISAARTAFLAPHGRSILLGNVVVSEKGREVKANKAYLYRNKLGKLTHIILVGNVHLFEAGKTLVAEKAFINMKNRTWTFYNVIYRLHQKNQFGDLEGWGTAEAAQHPLEKIFNVTGGTYSTCPPTRHIWSIKAAHLHLDQNKNRGTAINSFIRWHKIPIFYLPYWNFPLKQQRKTGFLFPTYAYSTRNGSEITVPFYWNIAPNYDETFSTEYISRRGALFNSLFRFLTPSTSGSLNADLLPNDRLFKSFQQQATSDGSGYQNHALNNLENADINRSHFTWESQSQYDTHWSSQFNLNYVTDDYFFQDLSDSPNTIIQTQLPNNGIVNYAGENWHFSAGILGYQTLHPLNQSAITDQYWRLPDLTATANYPNEKFGLNYAMSSELVHFEHANDFATDAPFTTGDRMNLAPSISLPLAQAAGYITPTVEFEATDYALENPGTNNPNHIDRAIPIYDIDSGLFFERSLHLFGQDYQQTLEPRLFYLYIPYHNQDDIPDFDTTLPTFDYGELFRTNRFIGYDRIGDANQLAYGVTSNLLDGYNGNQKLSLGLGEIYYLQRNKVCLPTAQGGCSADPSLRYDFSPIVSEASYNFNSRWNGSATAAWDPNQKIFDNGGANLQYQRDAIHVVNIGYQYVHEGDINLTNYSRVNLSTAWGMTQHWLTLLSLDYNVSQHYPQTYLYGLEYNSCCWAIRFVHNKTLIAINPNNTPLYDKKWYVQLQLKGLGNFGNNDPANLLMQNIGGYDDKSWRR